MTILNDVEDMIDAHAGRISELFDLTPPVGIPRNPDEKELPARQILIVQSVIHITSGFQRTGSSKPEAANVLRFLGIPSPKSQVTNGYMHFVPHDRIQVPRYNYHHNSINVSVDIAGMAQTLEQLRNTHRFLWIGWFEGGHIYSDLHSAD